MYFIFTSQEDKNVAGVRIYLALMNLFDCVHSLHYIVLDRPLEVEELDREASTLDCDDLGAKNGRFVEEVKEFLSINRR